MKKILLRLILVFFANIYSAQKQSDEVVFNDDWQSQTFIHDGYYIARVSSFFDQTYHGAIYQGIHDIGTSLTSEQARNMFYKLKLNYSHFFFIFLLTPGSFLSPSF